MDRHAAHRDVLALMLAALGQRDAERAAGDFRVLEEQLVEIAHAVEQQRIGIGRLDLDELLHGRPGKLEITPTKPMATQRDLSLAYSPGVAVPVQAIAEDPGRAFDYTTRGQHGGGDLQRHGDPRPRQSRRARLQAGDGRQGGAVQALRRRRFDRSRSRYRGPDAFINCVRYLGPTFGGINLEDIKAPECFIIEERLRELMDIPVFHDDQHGTAIIAAAGLINALHLTGRDIKKT
jgi:malate dehydrogenase (oxaloacetate-decarboxylating)(NADP+)